MDLVVSKKGKGIDPVIFKLGDSVIVDIPNPIREQLFDDSTPKNGSLGKVDFFRRTYKTHFTNGGYSPGIYFDTRIAIVRFYRRETVAIPTRFLVFANTRKQSRRVEFITWASQNLLDKARYDFVEPLPPFEIWEDDIVRFTYSCPAYPYDENARVDEAPAPRKSGRYRVMFAHMWENVGVPYNTSCLYSLADERTGAFIGMAPSTDLQLIEHGNVWRCSNNLEPNFKDAKHKARFYAMLGKSTPFIRSLLSGDEA